MKVDLKPSLEKELNPLEISKHIRQPHNNDASYLGQAWSKLSTLQKTRIVVYCGHDYENT